MSRNLLQRLAVYRGHHEGGADPDKTTVGSPSWTTSLGAADIYAREASIPGMAPENPVVSHRIYESERPFQFDSEIINTEYEFGDVLELPEEQVKYITETYRFKSSCNKTVIRIEHFYIPWLTYVFNIIFNNFTVINDLPNFLKSNKSARF